MATKNLTPADTALTALQLLEEATDMLTQLRAKVHEMDRLAEQLIRATKGQDHEEAKLFAEYIDQECKAVDAVSFWDVHWPLDYIYSGRLRKDTSADRLCE